MSNSGDLLGTGISGLLAFQRALATTSHNVSNVNTPGYSRQRVELSTRPPTGTGAGFVGNGVNTDSVTRSYDQFVGTQLRSTTSSFGQIDAYYDLAKQIDNIVADDKAGLAPALQDFFKAVQGVANDSGSATARQALLSQANSMAGRFHYLNERLDNLQVSINDQVNNSLSKINSLGKSLAALNQNIYEEFNRTGGQPPNDLLDRRDELTRQLAELVNVAVIYQDDGRASVFIGSGQALVLDNKSASLSKLRDNYNPGQNGIGMSFDGSAVVNITRSVNGGKLGGALSFQNETLNPAVNALGRVALGFAVELNEQHALGLDLSNNLGGDFFTDIDTATALAGSANNVATNYVYSSTVTNVAALKAADYRLDYNAGNFTVTRLTDSAVVYSGASAGIDLSAAEGFTLNASGTVINDGDSYLVRPTAHGAAQFGVEIGDTTKIAAAAPLRTRALNANLGSGKITQGTVSNTTNLPLASPISLQYDADALGAGIPGFTVTNGPGGTLAYDPATEASGKTFTLAAYGGFSFKLSGTPQDGDQFVIEANTNSPGDNRNALALGQLQTANTLLGGSAGATASFQGAYGQLVSDIGVTTHQAEDDRSAQTTLLTQATESWSNVSGVNLDEEAANVVRFQQAYQAAAQVISTASILFETLLAAVRR